MVERGYPSPSEGLVAPLISSFATLFRMNNRTYQGHGIELDAEEVGKGQWVARAIIVIDEGARPKRIPIFGRRRATFDSREEAESYGFELAKLWIEGKLSGSNGHGLPD